MSLKERLKHLFVEEIGKNDDRPLRTMLDAQQRPQRSAPEKDVYNPLALAINDQIELALEDAGVYDVCKILSYSASYGDRTYHSVKYFLCNTAADDADILVLEAMSSHKTSRLDYYLFHVIQESEYDEQFLTQLDSKRFVITEEYADGDVREKEYQKTFHITLQGEVVNSDGTQISRQFRSWNYELQQKRETLYLNIEMDTSDGWFTIYEGRKLLNDDVDIYPRPSGNAGE